MHLAEYSRIYIDVRSHLIVCKYYTRMSSLCWSETTTIHSEGDLHHRECLYIEFLISSSCWHACCVHRYFTITGQKADENTIEQIIETGESEKFLQKAIHEQGRGQILESIREIQERHDAVKEIERNLLELHQIFMDMAVLVEAQGEQLNDIESQVF